MPEVYDYFARLDETDYKRDLSDSLRGKGVEAILLSEGTAELSPIWGEKVKTQIYAVPYLEKTLSIRSPLSLTSGEVMQDHWIRDSLFYYPSFNRLQVREGATRIIGKEKLWNWQNIDSMYTTASDILNVTNSLNFNEFNIDPVFEVLSYYYVTPVEILNAVNATSGRRVAIRCRDPLGVENTFFMGVDRYRQVFGDTHPQRILQEHKPYFMFFGYGYFSSEAIFIDGAPIEKEDYIRNNFLGYLRRRKRLEKESAVRKFPGVSLKENDSRTYEYNGRIYYVPGFATQEETMLLQGQMEAPPYARYKVLNARNQWAAYLYANPETEGLYGGKTTAEDLLVRPSRPVILPAGPAQSAGPMPIPSQPQPLSGFSISVESKDTKSYAQILSDLLTNFSYATFELTFSGQDSDDLTKEIIGRAKDIIRAKARNIRIEFSGSYTMIDRRKRVTFLVQAAKSTLEPSSSPI